MVSLWRKWSTLRQRKYLLYSFLSLVIKYMKMIFKVSASYLSLQTYFRKPFLPLSVISKIYVPTFMYKPSTNYGCKFWSPESFRNILVNKNKYSPWNWFLKLHSHALFFNYFRLNFYILCISKHKGSFLFLYTISTSFLCIVWCLNLLQLDSKVSFLGNIRWLL